jgi:pimeloyl-ACP methyl ester carboxylesterase
MMSQYKFAKKSAPGILFQTLLLLVLAGGCAVQPTRPPAQTTVEPAVDFQDCQLTSAGMQSTVDARCGILPVYEDQAQKAGRNIDLFVAVIPAVSKSPAEDAVFLLAGGPGQAATEAFLPLIFILNRIHQDRDIILVDQRGTGKSNPLRCPAGAQAEGFQEDVTPEEQVEKLKACLIQMNADPRLYTTAAAVEDLEQVRSALGYDKINLVGVSYGTRVALAYQRQYPQSIRTVTLDSVAPVDWELGPENSANAQHALDLIFERCAADAACSAAFPNVREEFRTLLAALEHLPAEVELPHPTTGEITRVELTRDNAAATFQVLSYTPETVAYIPLLIHQTASRGDYDLLAAQYLIMMGELGQSIHEGLYLSVLCAEDVPFYPENPVPASSFLPDRTAEMAGQCAIWPHAQVPADFKQPVSSPIPTLLLSGEADPITPPSNAEHAAQTLSNHLSLVVPGIGHNVIYRGCVPRILDSFIETASTTGLDTACIQDIRPAPFLLNFSGSNP